MDAQGNAAALFESQHQVAQRSRALFCRRAGSFANIRPQKRHRRATCTWLRCVDKFLVNTAGAGSVQFQQPADPTQRESPFTWKCFSGCADMESTGHSGSGACQMHFTLNYDDFPDGSHGGQRAVIDGLKKSGMYP